LPLRSFSFDRIFSIGVLHHTPDPRRAFLALPRLLRPGGELAIWVYSGEPRFRLQYALSDLYRLHTRRMDRRRLLRWCERLEPLGRLYSTRLGRYLTPFLPVSAHPKRDWRVLDTFDWYSPRYQFKHTWREVESWFRDAGLVDVRRNPFEVSVVGRAPSTSSPRAR
jgi:SAM-dependent methyltransferase